MSANLQEALAQELLDVSYANRCNAHIRNGLPGAPPRNRVRDLGYYDVIDVRQPPNNAGTPGPMSPREAQTPASTAPSKASLASRLAGPALAALGIAGAGVAGYALAAKGGDPPPIVKNGNGDEGLIEYFQKKGLNIIGVSRE